MDPNAGNGHGRGRFTLIDIRNWDRLHFRVKKIIKSENRQEIGQHVLLNAAGDELGGSENFRHDDNDDLDTLLMIIYIDKKGLLEEEPT